MRTNALFSEEGIVEAITTRGTLFDRMAQNVFDVFDVFDVFTYLRFFQKMLTVFDVFDVFDVFTYLIFYKKIGMPRI